MRPGQEAHRTRNGLRGDLAYGCSLCYPSVSKEVWHVDTRLRLRVTPTMPRLPLQDGKYLGGAVVIGGALDYPLGFVPLGITEGVSQVLRGKATGKLLDPTCDTSGGSDPCATGMLPMRLAPHAADGSEFRNQIAAQSGPGACAGFCRKVANDWRTPVDGESRSQHGVSFAGPGDAERVTIDARGEFGCRHAHRQRAMERVRRKENRIEECERRKFHACEVWHFTATASGLGIHARRRGPVWYPQR